MRGLKYKVLVIAPVSVAVALLVSAWIEIMTVEDKLPIVSVALLVSAWIEIC